MAFARTPSTASASMSASSAGTPAPRRGASAAVALVVSLLLLPGCALRDQTPGACKLPPRAEHAVARFVHRSGAHYLQRDKRWAAEPIGGSGKPLCAVGCTLCCLSMALAEQGIDLSPP